MTIYEEFTDSIGERLVLNLTMLDYELPSVTSRNAFGEIVGASLPDEIVAVSGEARIYGFDCWNRSSTLIQTPQQVT